MTDEKSLIKQLNYIFYGSIISTIIFFVLVLFKVIPYGEPRVLPLAVSQYSIIVTLLGIPLALKLYANTIKNNAGKFSIALVKNKYKNAFTLRLSIITLLTLGNIILFGISRNTNYMWAVIILLVFFLFCKASEIDLEKISKTEE